MSAGLPDKQRFLLNVPFYVNGSLPLDEQAWMKAYLTEHPQRKTSVLQAQREYAYSQTLGSDVPESVRLKRLHQKLGWSNVDAPAQPFVPGRASPVLTRPWLSGLLGALAGGLVVGAIGLHLARQGTDANPDFGLTRGMRPACAKTQRLLITLLPQTLWTGLVALLREHHLQISDGPNQQGEIWVQVPPDTSLPEALASLRASPWVDRVVSADDANAHPPCQP